MRVRHDQRVTADAGYAASLNRPAVQRDALADHIVVAHLQPGLFALVGDVLRLTANGAERKKAVIRPDLCRPQNHHVRQELAGFAQFHLRAHDGIGADRARSRHPGRRINDCRGMNHSAGPAAPELSEAGLGRLISWHPSVASQTRLLSTKAFPPMRTATMPPNFFHASISTSSRS